jgi:hypothetical protein
MLALFVAVILQSACPVVPVALQTTRPAIVLLPWLLLFLGQEALPL